MRQTGNSRILAAASFLILMFAVVPGMAYTGMWSVPEGEVRVIVAEEPAGSQHTHADGHVHENDSQRCRVGPSRCTSQPSFVSTTWVGGDAWTIVPPGEAEEAPAGGVVLAPEEPLYRMKPPPREI